MLKLTQTVIPEGISVAMEGVIDETASFETRIPEVPQGKQLHVNLKGVSRINSLGVDLWIRFFHKFETEKVTVKFFECSPAIVTSFSHIVNFHCGAEIVSVFLPYSCGECNKVFLHLMKTETLRPLALSNQLPEFPCSNCGKGQLYFDDIPEEYFRFLKRKANS